MTIGWLLLIATAAIVLMCLASVLYMRLITGVMVTHKLEDIETIFDTGEPPAGWRGNRPCGANKRDIRRLTRLMRYLSKTRLVMDEQTRKEVADSLAQAKKQWLTRLQGNLNKEKERIHT